MEALPTEDRLKDLIKAAILELLEEQRGLLQNLIEEAVEDVAMSRAIQEGETSQAMDRDQILKLLRA